MTTQSMAILPGLRGKIGAWVTGHVFTRSRVWSFCVCLLQVKEAKWPPDFVSVSYYPLLKGTTDLLFEQLRQPEETMFTPAGTKDWLPVHWVVNCLLNTKMGSRAQTVGARERLSGDHSEMSIIDRNTGFLFPLCKWENLPGPTAFLSLSLATLGLFVGSTERQ